MNGQVKRPVVTAVMPTYNKGPYLQEAVDSILGQTWTDWELIVVDDGSTDETASVLNNLRDSRIRVHTLAANVGRAGARNVALAHATGRYIAICDSDDVSVATRFERQVEFLDSHPDVAVVSAYIRVMARRVTAQLDFPLEHAAIARRFAEGKMGVAHGVSLVRAECFQRLGFYCEELRSAEDFELFRRFARQYRFATLPMVLLEYRNELGAVPLPVWTNNASAHRYALYRSNHRGEGDALLSFEEFARAWKTKLPVYTLDVLRFVYFNVRAHVFSHYVLR